MSKKLRRAAQAVVDRWDSPKWAHDAEHTGELIATLRDALAEDALDEMQALTENEYRDPEISDGMTLRDYFAARAMAADIATSYHSVNDIAELAYKMADAMLEARGKE